MLYRHNKTELNGCLTANSEGHYPCHYITRPFTTEEMQKVTHALAKHKSPGHDGIMNEHVLLGGPAIIRALTYLFNAVIQDESTPNS